MRNIFVLFTLDGILLFPAMPVPNEELNDDLSESIRQDRKLDKVYEIAQELIKGGFSAGRSYGENKVRLFSEITF